MFKSNLKRDVSLARALSKIGFTSRKQAAVIIKEGRVSVNGKLILNPSFRCSLSVDKILIDGKKPKEKQLVYIAMNKPVGVLSTRSDEKGRKTVYDILGELQTWVFPIGRLDKDTSGLLLFTNDNQLGERLTNPLSEIPKTYHVKLNRELQYGDIKLIERGMTLNGERLLPARIVQSKGNRVEITIIEGKNRQIRRMFEELGYKILSLCRIRIGSLEFNDLKQGEWRYLNQKEIKKLMSYKFIDEGN